MTANHSYTYVLPRSRHSVTINETVAALSSETPFIFSRKLMTEQNHKIEFSDNQTLAVDQDPLIAVTKLIFSDFGYNQSELSIAFVDDVEIRNLNKQYLNHDYATDVISFVIDVSETSILGQLIVSTDTAKRLADEIGAPMQHELMLYVIHGTLHLVGLDDTDDASAEKMRAAEADYLGRFGIAHVWEIGLETSEEQ